MTSPRWARALLRFLAPPSDTHDLVGDYEESHRRRRALAIEPTEALPAEG